MKRSILFSVFAFIWISTFSQVGIGTTTPSPAAMLEVSSTSDGGTTYKGFMPPRVPNIAARDAIIPNMSDAGLLVFVMNTGSGDGCLQIWDGDTWEEIYCVTIPAPEIWINEFHYDNEGTDEGEFIEIAGPAGIDLSLYSLELYSSAGPQNYDTIALNGIIPNQSSGFGTLSFLASIIQNGPADGIAIVKSGVVIQFLSYEGTFTPNSGSAAGITSTDIGVVESGSTPVGYSLQLIGTGDSYVDFIWNAPSEDSPGVLNAGQIIN